jgi:hypothetical protein
MAKMHHRNMLVGGGFERRAALESGFRELSLLMVNVDELPCLGFARLGSAPTTATTTKGQEYWRTTTSGDGRSYLS